jgi:hypothetical protein
MFTISTRQAARDVKVLGGAAVQPIIRRPSAVECFRLDETQIEEAVTEALSRSARAVPLFVDVRDARNRSSVCERRRGNRIWRYPSRLSVVYEELAMWLHESDV